MCSNYKPQTEGYQQHLALYMDRHLRSVAIMIEVTSRYMECTHCRTTVGCLLLRYNGKHFLAPIKFEFTCKNMFLVARTRSDVNQSTGGRLVTFFLK